MRLLKNFPLFVILVSVFFVFHGYTAHYKIVSPGPASLLLLQYIVFSVLLAGIFYLLYRNLNKAALTTLFILSFNYFFGPVHDLLKSMSGNNGILARYSVTLPVSAIILIAICICLKRSKRTFYRTSLYLNYLFLLLILIDAGVYVYRVVTERNDEYFTSTPLEFSKCDTCIKPDIYLILVDEYAGQTQLKEQLNFDNSPFLTDLASRGFHVVPNSTSNYNYTHHSMASLLAMEYLAQVKVDEPGYDDLAGPLGIIKKSRAVKYLRQEGYSFYNYSLFDFAGNLSPAKPTFLPLNSIMITSQTFINRVQKDMGYYFFKKFNMKKSLDNLYYTDRDNNEKILDLTKKIAATKTRKPKFVYSHLVMPHYRYYYDSVGKEVPIEKVIDDAFCKDKKGYTSYLQYTNKKLLALVDNILHSSTTPPVIMLLSDHGYRQFHSWEDSAGMDRKYYFMNLNAIMIPGKNYQGFYDSVSNVNQFRVLFNTLFKQKFPLLKDSATYIPH